MLPGLLTALLLFSSMGSSFAQTWTFDGDSSPEPGQTYRLKSSWVRTGRLHAWIGKTDLKDSQAKEHEVYTVLQEILEVTDGVITLQRLTFGHFEMIHEGEAYDLGLSGKTVVATGPRGDCSFRFENGKRPNRKQRKFLEQEFDATVEDGLVDVHAVLIPQEPVAIGESWDIPLQKIFDPGGNRFNIVDYKRSRVTARLEAVDGAPGEELAHIRFSGTVLPGSIDKVTLHTGSIEVSGLYTVPIHGRSQESDLDFVLGFSFEGIAHRFGMDINFLVDQKAVGFDRVTRAP